MAAATALNVEEEDLEDFLQGIFEKDTDEEDIEDAEIIEDDVSDKEGFLQTNVTESSLIALLQRLSIADSNIESEQHVATSVLKHTSNTSKQYFRGFLDEVAKFLAQCYEVKSRKKRLRAIEIEKNFYTERSKCLSECTLGDSWKRILTLAKLERNASTDVVLQHILQHFWSTIGSRPETCTNTPVTPLSHKKPDEIELLAIKDHAGWAVKRARDIVKSSSELKIKQSPKASTILDVDKKQALDLISKLGIDQKQGDGQHRFIPNDNICPFFTTLHDITADQLSKANIYSHTGQVVVICLQFIARNQQLRQQWNSVVLKYGFPQEVNILILEKICTMFVKSKQQIIREQFALKPQKGSSALREDLKGKVTKSSKQNPKTKDPEQCSTQATITKSTPEVISELRQNFESPETVSHCLQKIVKEPNSKELLSHLTGKELTKLLLSLGKPGLDGKKKSRQIDILITGDLEVKYAEKLKGTTGKVSS